MDQYSVGSATMNPWINATLGQRLYVDDWDQGSCITGHLNQKHWVKQPTAQNQMKNAPELPGINEPLSDATVIWTNEPMTHIQCIIALMKQWTKSDLKRYFRVDDLLRQWGMGTTDPRLASWWWAGGLGPYGWWPGWLESESAKRCMN